MLPQMALQALLDLGFGWVWIFSLGPQRSYMTTADRPQNAQNGGWGGDPATSQKSGSDFLLPYEAF